MRIRFQQAKDCRDPVRTTVSAGARPSGRSPTQGGIILAEKRWITDILDAQQASNGVVRRSRDSVDKEASLDELIAAVKQPGCHLIETGGSAWCCVIKAA